MSNDAPSWLQAPASSAPVRSAVPWHLWRCAHNVTTFCCLSRSRHSPPRRPGRRLSRRVADSPAERRRSSPSEGSRTAALAEAAAWTASTVSAQRVREASGGWASATESAEAHRRYLDADR
eukprot:scaffold1026_cov272-Pinguiococcus_pyrenoidosus.AAC.4